MEAIVCCDLVELKVSELHRQGVRNALHGTDDEQGETPGRHVSWLGGCQRSKVGPPCPAEKWGNHTEWEVHGERKSPQAG